MVETNTTKKEPKEMRLGELIDAFINLKNECLNKIVNENDPGPYPEVYNKDGGVREHNKKIIEEYEQKRKCLISELNRREQFYKSAEELQIIR